MVVELARPGILRCFADHFLKTGVVIRMSGENAMIAAGFSPFLFGNFDIEQLLILERTYNIDHRLRVIVTPGKVLGPQPIRFQLMIAPIARKKHISGNPEQALDALRQLAAGLRHEYSNQYPPHRRGHIGYGGRAILLYAVARGDVSDFMPQHCRKLGFRVEIGEDSASDVDVAPWESEGIDLGAVENGEMIVDLRPVASFREFLANFVDILLQAGQIVVRPVGLAYLKSSFPPLAHLIVFRHKREIAISGNRIDRAAAQQDKTAEYNRK